MIERKLETKSKVIKTVKESETGDQPYELVQEYDEYEIIDDFGQSRIEKRNVRLATHTISTDKYDKEAEVEKREEKVTKKKATKKKSAKSAEDLD